MNRKKRIESKLIENFEGWEIIVNDVSVNHAGHNNFDGKNETHFSLLLTNPKNIKFNKLSIHRKIYNLLNKEFTDGLHSLEIKFRD